MKTIILLIGGILGIAGICMIDLSLDFKFSKLKENKHKAEILQNAGITLGIVGAITIYFGGVL